MLRNRSRIILGVSTILCAAAALYAARPVEASKQTYAMQCRGGMEVSKDLKPKNEVAILLMASRSSTAASSTMAEGSCAWLDRPMNSNEIPHILIKTDVPLEISFILPDLTACMLDPNCIVEFKAYTNNSITYGKVSREVRFMRATN